jgi:PhnB protein
MTTDTSQARDDARIRTVIDDRARALRAKDAAGVVRHHAPDVVQFSLAPPLVSTAADAKGLEAWFATWHGPLGYEIHDLDVTAGGDTAFSHRSRRRWPSRNRARGPRSTSARPST